MRNTSYSVTLRNEYVLKRIKDIKVEHPFWGASAPFFISQNSNLTQA